MSSNSFLLLLGTFSMGHSKLDCQININLEIVRKKLGLELDINESGINVLEKAIDIKFSKY
jgi:hypothetical protein